MKQKYLCRRFLSLAIAGIVVVTMFLLFISSKNTNAPPVTDDDIPLPFNFRTSESLVGKLVTLGQKRGVTVRQVTFDQGEAVEILRGTGAYLNSMDFILIPHDTPGFEPISDGAKLCQAVTAGKKYFGYKYTSSGATLEKERRDVAINTGTPSTLTHLFPGEFFASAAMPTGTGTFITDFENATNEGLPVGDPARLSFANACNVTLDRNARYLIKVTDENLLSNTTFRARGLVIDVPSTPIKFFIHPSLVNDKPLNEVGDDLRHYVNDMNGVYAKNTVVRLTFDSALDVTVWDTEFPQSVSCHAKPNNEVHVFIDSSGEDFTYSTGSGGCHENALAVFNLRWGRIWSRVELEQRAQEDMVQRDYATQLQVLIHELSHAFGLGIGEYYSMAIVEDKTGIAPLLDVNFYSNPTGPYWGTRTHVLQDPMIRSADTIGQARALVFSPLSATIINKYVRGEFDDDDCWSAYSAWCSPPQAQSIQNEPVNIAVSVIDALTKNVLNGCSVKSFYVNPIRGLAWGDTYPESFAHALIAEGMTNADGGFNFDWGTDPFDGTEGIHVGTNLARLVKVSCDGYEPNGDWITTFDVQAGLVMLQGGQENDFRYPGKMIMEMKKLHVTDTPVCGNGTAESGEACDDGGTILGDVCSAICQIEPGYT